LLVVFWWKRGRLSWRRDVVPLAPWFALAGTAGWLTAWFERTRIGAQGADFSLTLAQRGLLAGRVIWFYLGKLVWPADLIFIYPRWTVDPVQAWQWLFPLAALALLVGLWLGRRRGAVAGLLFFVGTLFPALGFINVFPFLFSFVADHFQYLACTGILALGSAGLESLRPRLPAAGGRVLAALGLAALGILTWHQSATYRDVFTLYETTLAKNPACWLAHNNLAEALANSGRTPEAISHLEQALRLRPGFPEAENNLGDDLRQLGRPQEALPHLERALRLQPTFAEAHNNLGAAFMMTGRSAKGIAEFIEALRLKPGYAVARFNLGLARANAGQPDQAIGDFAEAVRLKPDFGQAELNWGIGLTLAGRFPEARTHFERALQLEPDSPAVHYGFARALAGAGRLDEAIAHYEQALRLAPDFAEAHSDLALALRQAGRMSEADAHYQEATRLNARGAPAQN
jgi:tetratricopeptide (TPR) repeat protein